MLSSWSLLDLGVVAPLMVPEDQPWGDYFPGGRFSLMFSRGSREEAMEYCTIRDNKCC